MTDAPRIVVFAYSEMGARCLETLLAGRHRVVAVYTHHDDPGETRWFRSVAEIAESSGIPVCRPSKLKNPRELEQLRAFGPDLIFSFYYRRLIPDSMLALPRLGAFNMHGSLLPRYRGRAPVHWAILNGERETGATLHHMVAEADAGDIVDQEAVPIGPEDVAAEVNARVVDAGCRILERQLRNLVAGCAPRRAQDESQATTFGRRTPEDGRFEWDWEARRIADLVRAVARPFPGAFCTRQDGTRLYVWGARALAEPTASEPTPGRVVQSSPPTVACGRGALELHDWEWRPGAGMAEFRVGDRI